MASRSNSPKKNTVKMYGNHQPDSSSIFLYDLIRVCRDILNLMGIELTLRSSSTPNEEKKPWDPQLVDSSASKRGARPRTRTICRWSEVDWSSTCTACCYTWGNKILFLFSPLPALCRNCHERHESWKIMSRKIQYTIHFWKVTPKTWTKLLQWAIYLLNRMSIYTTFFFKLLGETNNFHFSNCYPFNWGILTGKLQDQMT